MLTNLLIDYARIVIYCGNIRFENALDIGKLLWRPHAEATAAVTQCLGLPRPQFMLPRRLLEQRMKVGLCWTLRSPIVP